MTAIFSESDTAALSEESSGGQLLNRVDLIKTLLDHQRRAEVGVKCGCAKAIVHIINRTESTKVFEESTPFP